MESPIHAANEVDKGEAVPKIVAAVAGLIIIVVGIIAAVYSGVWSPPATQVSHQAQTTQK